MSKGKKHITVTCTISDEEFQILNVLRLELNMPLSEMLRQGLKLFAEQQQKQ